MSRMAYLAYPIDQHNLAGGVFALINEVKDYLVHDVVFDPGDAFRVKRGAEPGPEIAAINAHAAAMADTVVAFLPAGAVTVGVPIEIDRAVRAGKVVALFTDSPAWMLQYGDVPTFRRFHLDQQGTEEAYRWIHETQPLSVPDEPDPLPTKVWDAGRLPTRGHADDAGLDLYVARAAMIPAHKFVDVACHVAVELPDWSWGLLTGRSSTLRNRNLLVQTAVIDAGYRGELFLGVWNLSDQPAIIEDGARIGQLIVLPNLTKDLQPVQVQELTSSERGDAGFGSTGA